MLVRAARRKARYHDLRLTLISEQLQLPWLCPAYIAPFRDSKRSLHIDTTFQSHRVKNKRSGKDVGLLHSRQASATAFGDRSINDIPFEALRGRPPPSPSASGNTFWNNAITELRPFDPSSIPYFDNSLHASPVRHRVSRQGVGGDLSEMLSVFEACLQVGRIERAGVILRRIYDTGTDTALLLELHNTYLRCAVEQNVLKPSKTANQEIHKWFELEIIKNRLLPDAEMIAYMVKASLLSTGARRERLVRRYMDMVPEGTGYQVLCLDILTAREVNEVTHICPAYTLGEEAAHASETTMDMDADQFVEPKATPADDIVANVRPTEQKGLGLKALKQTLSLFSNLPQQGIDMANTTAEGRREIQTRLEHNAVTSAIDRWREESSQLVKMGLNTSLQTKSLGARMWRWQLALQDYLEDEVKKVDASEAAEKKTASDLERCIYGPFLRLLPPDKLAALTILSTMTALGSHGVDKGLTLPQAIMAIAHSAEDESACEVLQRNVKNSVWEGAEERKGKSRGFAPEWLKKAKRFRVPGSAARLASGSSNRDGTNIDTAPRRWPMTTKAKVGAFLMSALIETAKVPVSVQNSETKLTTTQMQPAFIHSHQYKQGKKVGIIIANKVLVEQLKREPVHSLLAKHLPMLVTPEPWTQFNKGGFITHPGKVMRIKLGDQNQRHYAEAAIGQGDMEQTFKGLDVLGRTSWQINQPVFDIMLEAWNSGEAIAKIPPESPQMSIPQEPDSSQDPMERRRWIRNVKKIENLKSGLHSQRCFQNFQLEIARALRNETFYFPHNVDFRGRAYPIPPYLNHMGADNCRGLLRFGKGKELGDSGMKWLKIHLANVYGFDKASLSERESFATNHLGDIYDSALNPLQGKRWWLNAEDPWQCLAACIEIRNAIESGNPTTFVSHLPVHQDGTCNGLQHYAALGGDTWGAKQVNLEPGDRPADVYTAVADLVKISVAKDKAVGHPCAVILDGKITRKTVKQTVMTNVYGVTFIGAKAQVRKQLVAAYNDLPNTDSLNPGHLSSYIATKIFTALSTMFKGAHDIQYWLGECASRISMSLTQEQMDRMEGDLAKTSGPKMNPKAEKSFLSNLEDTAQFKSTVIWTTPLHLPVVQPYRKSKSKTVSTHMQKISLAEPHRSHPVHKRKQLQGFPPNFIHSLDATHMLLSALRCDELGMSFAAVHDSFWTHAADIPAMNEVLRDSFIRIHQEDVIGRLASEFEARYKNCMYLAHVRTDTAVYQKIRAWRSAKAEEATTGNVKNFVPRLSELLLERERSRLLASENPNDIKKGKAMITPSTIFSEMAAEVDLAPDSDSEALGLGDISTREARLGQDEEVHLSDSVDVEVDLEENEVLDDKEDTESGSSIVAEENGPSTFEKELSGPRHRQNQAIASKNSQIWLPLTFPPVPMKGAFDVSRLRTSQYFFS